MSKLLEKSYNNIYDVFQEMRNIKKQPTFDKDENTYYKCDDLSLKISCNQGKILKYILLSCKKNNKNDIIIKLDNDDMIYLNGQILLTIIKNIKNILTTENLNLDFFNILNIIDIFLLSIDKAVTSPTPIIAIAPAKAPAKASPAKALPAKAPAKALPAKPKPQNLLESFRETVKNVKGNVEKVKQNLSEAAQILTNVITPKEENKGVFSYIISLLNTLEQNLKQKLDVEKNKNIPINKICVTGKNICVAPPRK